MIVFQSQIAQIRQFANLVVNRKETELIIADVGMRLIVVSCVRMEDFLKGMERKIVLAMKNLIVQNSVRLAGRRRKMERKSVNVMMHQSVMVKKFNKRVTNFVSMAGSLHITEL